MGEAANAEAGPSRPSALLKGKSGKRSKGPKTQKSRAKAEAGAINALDKQAMEFVSDSSKIISG